MNMEVRTTTKNDVEKDLFNLNNPVFRKTIESIRKGRNIKLVTIDGRRSHLVLKQNHHKTKCFSENLLEIEINKTEVKMKKPVYLKACRF